ncbi:hypothetical protein LMG22037_03206 [Paraburkholderia phenoliruptrix]|uniref:Uncharacterized protein n=1 Tax=Paraburkholderia phenoliruptrix TaxID=252970 RepID=A0A6J5B8S5_9BURK|nr:hypothetical protein LMG22037_03206 [Paraburkholderia phenoliruptrix]
MSGHDRQSAAQNAHNKTAVWLLSKLTPPF